jgi:hypothetical protein
MTKSSAEGLTPVWTSYKLLPILCQNKRNSLDVSDW